MTITKIDRGLFTAIKNFAGTTGEYKMVDFYEDGTWVISEPNVIYPDNDLYPIRIKVCDLLFLHGEQAKTASTLNANAIYLINRKIEDHTRGLDDFKGMDI